MRRLNDSELEAEFEGGVAHAPSAGAPLVVLAVDLTRTVTSATGRALSVLGIDPAAWTGGSADQLWADAAWLQKAVTRALEGSELTLGGKLRGRWFEAHCAPVRDGQGTLTGMMLVAADITERRATEEALRGSEARYRALVEHAPEAIVVLDYDTGKFVDLNGSAESLFAMSRQQLLQVGPVEMSPRCQSNGTSSAVAAQVWLEQALAGETPRFEWLHLDAHGQTIDCELRLLRLPHSEKRLIRGSIVDLSSKMKSARALQTAEDRFRTAIDSIGDAVIAADQAGKIEHMNPMAEKLTGYVLSDARARPIEEVYRVIDAETRVEAQSARERAETAHRDRDGRVPPAMELLSRDGATLAIHETLAAIKGPNGDLNGIVVVFRDISEERRAQKALFLADRLTAVATLAAGAAHEINNPLSYVVANVAFGEGQVEALSKDLEQWGNHPHPEATRQEMRSRLSQLREALEEARAGGDRVRQVVRDLKLFSRADDDHEHAVDLVRLLDLVVKMADHEIQHRASLTKKLPASASVKGSEARLGQVFLNLIVNAAQAIPEGGADAHEIRVTLTRDGEFESVQVSDNGPGIAEDHLIRIFDPFFTTKGVGSGSGLGLAISHGIVTALGGTITVESQLGKGTTFTVRLPRCEITLARPTPVPQELAGSPGKVLVIDDEALIGKTIARMLAPPLEVFCETRARAALARLERGETFDAILCDLMMPELTGMDFFAAVARDFPAFLPKIVFLTGGAFTPTAAEFLQRVDNRCIEKPFTVAEIRAAAERVLRARSHPNQGDG